MIGSISVNDKDLNRAISRAKSNVGKKLDRIRKRENFSPEVMRILDPRRNVSTGDLLEWVEVLNG